MIPEVFEQAQALTTLHGRPLVVLTASETLDTTGWAAAQDKLAALSTNHVHRDVDVDPRRPGRGRARLRRSRCRPSPRSSPPSAPAHPWPRRELRPIRPPDPRTTTPRGVPMSHTTAHPAPHAEEEGHQKSWALLAVALAAQILVVLDISVVNTALPSIGRDLDLERRRPPVAGHRLPDDVRRWPPARGPHLRPAVATRRLPHRPDAVHRSPPWSAASPTTAAS